MGLKKRAERETFRCSTSAQFRDPLGPRCRSETGAPSGPRASRGGGVLPSARKKQWQRTPFAAGEFGGKCERGDSPLSQKGNDQSELAAARRRRAREFRFRREAPGGCRMGPGLPWARKQGLNPLSGPIRERLGGSNRREAPGGPRTGPQLQAELRPKAIPDHGPVRGPLDPDRRSETGAPAVRAAWRSVVGAGFALTRDAGRRPALQAVPALHAWWRTAECAKKTMAANSVRCRRVRGKV